MTSWVDHVIWWHVYPLGFVGAARPSAGAARPPPDRGLAGPPGLARRERAAARAGVHLDQPRLRHHRLSPRSTRGSATTTTSTGWSTACHDRGIRVLLDGVFNHAGREFPPVARALAEGPGSPAADWVHRLYEQRRHGHRRLLRGPRHPGHAEPRLAAGPAVRPRRHAALAAPGDRRLAARRRVRRAGLVLGGGAARGPAGVRRGVDRGGDDPRRLRRLRRGVRDRLGDPVRAVARHLVRPGQRQPARAGLDARPAPQLSSSICSR